MTTTLASATARADRPAPRLGGFSTTYLALELRRVTRNRRTVVFTLVMPAVLFLLFGTGHHDQTDRVGAGNVTAYVLVSMAVYGAMLASTSAGATVSIERAAGWTRQLRLTPLQPPAYVAVKLVVAMILGGVAVAVAYLVGSLSSATMPAAAWVETAALGWLCSLVFAAFGLFMGYLLPSENVMQVIGPVLGVLAFAGGLFVPIDQMGSTFATLAKFSPTYGVGEIARYPLTHDGDLAVAAVNVLVWTAVFVVGAATRYRRDTARV
jgi:ABC-2 type transport system permease protein